jgi:hypothetical protein
MSLLIAALCLLNPVTFEGKQERPSVRVFVVSQHRFNNRGHHPWNNRRVVFKLVNDGDRPVTVYGTKFDYGFEPTGYMISLNRDTGNWEYPNPDNTPISWGDRSDGEKQTKVLLPGEWVTFVAEMSRFELGMHLKRTVYLSVKEGEQPLEIRGDEFVLK